MITSGFPTATGGRGPAENPAYRTFADALRANPLDLYQLLGIAVRTPSAPPVVTADNVQQLSGKTPAQVTALLEYDLPGHRLGVLRRAGRIDRRQPRAVVLPARTALD